MSVHAYHPETGGSAVLTEDQLAHMRQAGWMLQSEFDEQEAARAEAAAAEAAAEKASKTAQSGKDK